MATKFIRFTEKARAEATLRFNALMTFLSTLFRSPGTLQLEIVALR